MKLSEFMTKIFSDDKFVDYDIPENTSGDGAGEESSTVEQETTTTTTAIENETIKALQQRVKDLEKSNTELLTKSNIGGEKEPTFDERILMLCGGIKNGNTSAGA